MKFHACTIKQPQAAATIPQKRLTWILIYMEIGETGIHRRTANTAKWLRKISCVWNVRGIPRLLHSTRHFFLGRESQFFELENGLSLHLNPEDYVQCMMYYGRYSPEVLELFKHYVKPGDKVIDVGAHIGYFSIFLASLVDRIGTVYSFEPDPRALQSLEKTVHFNRLDWVKIFPVALSSHRSSIDFYLAQGLGSSTAAKNGNLEYVKKIAVETITLDTLVEQKKIAPDIRFIKMDIEGFEVEAIKGMKRVLETSRPVIVSEVNEEMLAANGENSETLFNTIRSFDYQIQAIRKSDTLFCKRYLNLDPITLRPKSRRYYDILCLPE